MGRTRADACMPVHCCNQPGALLHCSQVLQAEADDAADKALSRYLYRAFSDAGGYSSTDNNPLLRRNKLSRTNPLL